MAAKARSSGAVNTKPRQLFTGKAGAVRTGGTMTDSGITFNEPGANRSQKVAVNDEGAGVPGFAGRQGSTSVKDVGFRSGAAGDSMGGQSSQDFTATGGARALFPSRPRAARR